MTDISQQLLFCDMDKKIANAVERVRDAYKFSQSLGMGKLYVAFSGGKDSVSLYGVVKKAAEADGIALLEYAEFHYSVTGIDPPELVYFIRREFPFVHRDLYRESMWQLIERKQMPPTRLVRYCCSELKERGGEGKFCLTGIRWAESTSRSTRGVYESIGTTRKDGKILFNDNDEDRRTLEHCIPKQKYVVNPIIDWTDEDVWRFIKSEGLPYCKLYDEGYERLGCIGCPMAGGKRQVVELAKYPKFRQAYVRAFGRMIAHRIASGLPTEWKTGEEVMEWWTSERADAGGNELFKEVL
ncbi:MAG: phosphoadenosine phosphosulfate reductase [Spirochaetia bacterium]|nr:phosphoadenosine phosphosulfate reductase [Spirochaetia bacterium]